MVKLILCFNKIKKKIQNKDFPFVTSKYCYWIGNHFNYEIKMEIVIL